MTVIKDIFFWENLPNDTDMTPLPSLDTTADPETGDSVSLETEVMVKVYVFWLIRTNSLAEHSPVFSSEGNSSISCQTPANW